MEKLRTLVDTELLKSEFVRRLKTFNDCVVNDVRSNLYCEAKSKGLMEKGDQPVSRRKCATGKTVKEKHIDDIWCLMRSIKNSKRVDRVLLKNGKRSRGELEKSQKLAVVHDSSRSISSSRACAVSSPSTILPPMTTATPSAPRTPSSNKPNKPSTTPGCSSASAARTSVCHACQHPSSPLPVSLAPPPLSTTLDERFFRSNVLAEIQKIKQDLILVKSNLQAVERKSCILSNSGNNFNSGNISEAHISDVSTLYVKLKKIYDPPMGKLGLEALMKCNILCYARVGDAAYKVKVKTCQLKAVMENSHVEHYFVDTWKCRSAAPTPTFAGCRSQYVASTSKTLPLKVTSWNCRGLSNSTPYLNNLISEGSDIIVISEHWLWPFELHRLNEIHPDCIGHGQADARLTSSSDGRGLGGIGVIWQRGLDISVVHATTSDRICCVRMTHQSSNSILSVIGVYLPCQDLGIDLYRNCLTELEQLVVESKRMGPTVIMGDFNAHLGCLGGPRGFGSPNIQGHLLQQHILNCDVFVATQSEYAFGPSHTLQRGDVRTTIDYIYYDGCECSVPNGELWYP